VKESEYRKLIFHYFSNLQPKKYKIFSAQNGNFEHFDCMLEYFLKRNLELPANLTEKEGTEVLKLTGIYKYTPSSNKHVKQRINYLRRWETIAKVKELAHKISARKVPRKLT
jgi:hypothetical protein